MTRPEIPPTAANRLGLDYRAEASRFPVAGSLEGLPIIDAHTHINGRRAAAIYGEAAALYGVRLTYSMTWWEELPAVRETLGDRVRFIAFPRAQHMHRDRDLPAMGLIRQIEEFHAAGARMLKFWMGPRIIDFVPEVDPAILQRLDAPPRLEAMDRAAELDMMFMVHVADPDTWFRTTYADTARYRAKPEHYEGLHRVLEIHHDRPWIAAHMGGWPEDLEFLTRLLERHEHLHLDTSACKWMVRELGRHPREALVAFLERFRDRIIFGSDIVVTEEHLATTGDTPMAAKARYPEEAFDLYASRYWAYRTMFETDHRGESPIADPDLALVEPERHDALSAPPLVGRDLDPGLLRAIYHDNAERLLGHWYGDHARPWRAGG